MRVVVNVLLLAVACGAPDPVDLPDPAALPEVVDPPPALVMWADGAPVDDAAGWTADRVPELDRLFAHYVYGEAPAGRAGPSTELGRRVVGGATLVEIEATAADHRFLVALWLPKGPGPHPVLLGLNKCGNRTVADEDLRDGGGYADPTCDAAPGSRAGYWSRDVALADGWAVATVHQSDFAPDDQTAAHPAPAVATWAWGLSRAVDVLERLPEVDPDRIAVFGHSRRGKAALVATAADARIAAVWAHQSGTVGAALSRSYEGESIDAITTLFPHWFDPRLAEFAGAETRLPLDQHLLLARVAPRPLLVIDGDDDAWADPEGARQAVALSAEVFALLGGPAPVWTHRPGGHEVRREDWQTAIAFLAGALPEARP